ncbi:hypothetical protein GJ744_008833 [Endocarpon pusillum]|uniref:MARVEL domain-containing protein n=1 Tax=Endocarpon pusillum TaxID=364733 RepID=A0A8H7ASH1_9EURO|nr:hypothetical protein GJ744_008833 [Endocarpon pusillum]
MYSTTSLAFWVLRVGQLLLACVIAGIIGSYLHNFNHRHSWPRNRFIFTEVLAALSILCSLLWLLLSRGGIWPLDVVLAAAWFSTFGLLINWLHGHACGGTLDGSEITSAGHCNELKAAEALSFLSAIFWSLSAIIGIYYMTRAGKGQSDATNETGNIRRRWYQGPRV